MNDDFKVKSASKSFYKKYLFNKEEIKGKSIFEIGNRIWDIPKLRDLLKTTPTVTDIFNDLEIKVTFPDIGEKIMALNTTRIIKKKQDKKFILLTIKYITEVRKLGFEQQSKEQKVLAEKRTAEKALGRLF